MWAATESALSTSGNWGFALGFRQEMKDWRNKGNYSEESKLVTSTVMQTLTGSAR